nr:hypothetical protein [Tanacetum cinerariifolium]
MSIPTIAETYNLVAFLEKQSKSEGFEQIIDFLNAKSIRYALTVKGMAKHKEIYVMSSHTKNIFANMRRQGQGFSGNVTPLFETMMAIAQEEVVKEKSEEARKEEKIKTCRAEKIKEEIALVNESQGRMQDADMFGVHDLEGNEVFVEKSVEKEVSTTDPVTTAGKVVIAASVEDNVAPTTATTVDVDDELTLEKTLIAIKAAKPKVIPTAITIPRAKGIVFHEQVQAHKPVFSSKDKGKEKMIEPEKPLKKKDQIALNEEVAMKLEAKMRAEMEEKERIAREKDEANRDNVEESVKKTKAEGSSKTAADDDTIELKRYLEIVPEDDDVAIEATPLSSKSPTIVDYKIYREGKKSYFKIIKANGNLQNYLTFRTMFKNFNRADLEV